MDEHFKNLFAGSQKRFLTFTKMTMRDDGKQMPDYRTVDRCVTDADWARHLNGDASLGLSPLDNGMVKWGAVDVDFYRKEGPLLQNDDEVAQSVLGLLGTLSHARTHASARALGLVQYGLRGAAALIERAAPK